VDILKKLQSRSEGTKKLILWLTVIVLAIIMIALWIPGFIKRAENFSQKGFGEQIEIPSFQQELEGVIEPELSPEIGEMLEDIIKQGEITDQEQ